MKKSDYMTTGEAAREAGVSPQRVKFLAKNFPGRFTTILIGTKKRKYLLIARDDKWNAYLLARQSNQRGAAQAGKPILTAKGAKKLLSMGIEAAPGDVCEPA